MKKHLLHILFSLVLSVGYAQQTPSYTQFVLNQYALNPAYAGTNLGYEIITGRRVQWVGFADAPVTNFFSFTYAWRKNYNYKGKQAVGCYIEDDRQGLYNSKGAYVSYSYHLKIFTGLNIAAGISAGVRQIGINTNNLQDPTDPALNFQKTLITLYPDIIPGMRFYTKKLFIDLSARQLYKNNIAQGAYQIGSPPSRLAPTFIVAIKRRFYIGDNTWMVVPALKVQSTDRMLIPLVEGNLMVFYDRRIGVGASVRGNSFASAIIQLKLLKNIVVGFSYDYATNRMRAAAANSFEIVLGFTPGSSKDDRDSRPRKVASCPDFDF